MYTTKKKKKKKNDSSWTDGNSLSRKTQMLPLVHSLFKNHSHKLSDSVITFPTCILFYINRGYLIFFFQCKIDFYFTEWTPKAVVSRVAVATSENAVFGVNEWNKIRSYTEKNRIFCFFMLLFTIIKLLPTLRLSCQKTNFFLAIWRQFDPFQGV